MIPTGLEDWQCLPSHGKECGQCEGLHYEPEGVQVFPDPSTVDLVDGKELDGTGSSAAGPSASRHILFSPQDPPALLLQASDHSASISNSLHLPVPTSWWLCSTWAWGHSPPPTVSEKCYVL